jgi:3-oxoacyl-(acyl-carrier-protein) synthase
MMKERDVVITGMGLLSPLGIGVEENWENVKALKTGIATTARRESCSCNIHGKGEEFEAERHFPQAHGPDEISGIEGRSWVECRMRSRCCVGDEPR